MQAKITYKLAFIPYPWDEKKRKSGLEIYALVKRVVPEFGMPTEEAVAVFNFDSEARQFGGHVILSGLEGKLVEVQRDLKELVEAEQSLKKSRGWD